MSSRDMATIETEERTAVKEKAALNMTEVNGESRRTLINGDLGASPASPLNAAQDGLIVPRSLDLLHSLALLPPSHPTAVAAGQPVWWTAGITASATNYGASCTMSCFRPKVEPGDLSMLSISVGNDDSSHGEQSIQAGWIRSPTGLAGVPSTSTDYDLCQLFVYFTTVGSSGTTADFVKGYNDSVQGWVSIPGAFRPGVDVLPGSIIDGASRSIDLKFQLVGDRWNLRMNGSIIGYYPTFLFTTDRRDPANPPLEDVSNTLADHANKVAFIGQVFDSTSGGLTSTDIGSGKFPEEGFQRSAFINKMQYQLKPTATDPRMEDADESWARHVDDPERYSCLVSWKSRSSWRTYMYVGGPGCEATGWSAWDSAGGFFPTPDAGVTALSRRVGVIDLFTVGLDGKVYTSWWIDDNWSGYNNDWRPLDWGGGLTFLPKPKVVALSRTPDNLDIFAMGTDFKIYWARWSEGHDWTGWTGISTTQAFGPGLPPLLAAVSRHPGQMDVFATSGGVVFSTHWTDGVTDWTGISKTWDTVGRPSNIPQLWNILVLSRNADSMDLVTTFLDPLGPSNFVCNTWSNGTWGGFKNVGTAPESGAMTATSVAGVVRANRIDLFAMGTDSQVYTTHGIPPDNWAGVPDKWTKIGDPVLTFSNINNIIAVSRKSSCVDVFVEGMDGQVYTSSLDTSLPSRASWSSWRSLGGKGFARFSSFGIAACSRNHQTLAVFGRDEVGKVWVSEWYDPICGPRPFYCMAHNPNHVSGTVDDPADALRRGANCLAPDINKSSTGRLVVSHGGSDSDPEFVFYLQHLHSLAVNNPQLALIAWDCKAAVHDPDLAVTILTLIRQNLTHDLPLWTILSVPELADAPKMFSKIQCMLGPRELIAIDEENNVMAAGIYFSGAGITSQAAWGNGFTPALFQDPFFIPSLRRSVEQGVGMRAGQGAFQSVYTWTLGSPNRMRDYIRIGVDGIMSDAVRDNLIGASSVEKPLEALIDLVKTDLEMKRLVRMATRDDPIIAELPPAYELTVKTGSQGGAGTDAKLTFTVRGELGVFKKTVDTSLRGSLDLLPWPPTLVDGRMESGSTDFVVIRSRDVGELIDVTVFNDMSRSLLGNSRWRCDNVRVQSALYGVDRTATFGVDVGNLPVTMSFV